MGELVQGENKGRKGKGRGQYVWNKGLPTSRHYLIIPQLSPASNLQPPDGEAEPLQPVLPARGEKQANET